MNEDAASAYGNVVEKLGYGSFVQQLASCEVALNFVTPWTVSPYPQAFPPALIPLYPSTRVGSSACGFESFVKRISVPRRCLYASVEECLAAASSVEVLSIHFSVLDKFRREDCAGFLSDRESQPITRDTNG